MSIKDILDRDEIAGAREEKSHAAETAILDFRPYRMRQQPLPREGLQREQEIKESLRREDRGVAVGLDSYEIDVLLRICTMWNHGCFIRNCFPHWI